jgi:hypothetical protein
LLWDGLVRLFATFIGVDPREQGPFFGVVNEAVDEMVSIREQGFISDSERLLMPVWI